MARVDLRERFIGGGLVGEIETAPCLSWTEHEAILRTAAAAQATAQQGESMARALFDLESELGLHLRSQTQLLSRQLDSLSDIAESLRTPAKTRAAERIVDTGELLRRGRFERALEVAEEAIDGDPNNAAGFLAMAWASVGLGYLTKARDAFREARAASDGDARSSSNRQAARLTFALEGAEEALRELRLSREQSLSPREERAVEYDRIVYETAAGRGAEQADAVMKLGAEAGLWCELALVDPILAEEPFVRQAAESQRDATTAQLNIARIRFDAAVAHLLTVAEEAIARYRALDVVVPYEFTDARTFAQATDTRDRFDRAMRYMRPRLAEQVIEAVIGRVHELRDPLAKLEALEAARALEERVRLFAREQNAEIVERRGDVWVIANSGGVFGRPSIWVARHLGNHIAIERHE